MRSTGQQFYRRRRHITENALPDDCLGIDPENEKLLYKAPSGNMVSRAKDLQIRRITQTRCCLLSQADLLPRLTAPL
jgi:hypothetical protein